MMALTTASTLFLKIPVSLDGYINLGDAVIFISAYFTGGLATMLSGGIGSMLADFLGGYAYWAPWTLIIKGLEGLVSGLLCTIIKKNVSKVKTARLFVILTFFGSSLLMILGYFVVRWLAISQSLSLAVSEIPFNLIQSGASILLSGIIVTTYDIKKKSISHGDDDIENTNKE